MSFSLKYVKLVFTDGSVSESDFSGAFPLPKPTKLSSSYDNDQLDQFLKRFGAGCVDVPQRTNGLYHCACGVDCIEGICPVCGRMIETMLAVDPDELKKAAVYEKAKLKKAEGNIESCREAAELFKSIADYSDSDFQAEDCNETVGELLSVKAKRRSAVKKSIFIGIPAATAAAAAVVFIFAILLPKQKLNEVIELIEQGKTEAAYVLIDELSECKSINNEKYSRAIALAESGEKEVALMLFEQLGEYKDSADRLRELK